MGIQDHRRQSHSRLSAGTLSGRRPMYQFNLAARHLPCSINPGTLVGRVLRKASSTIASGLSGTEGRAPRALATLSGEQPLNRPVAPFNDA